MLAGIAGHLIAEAILEEHVGNAPADASLTDAHRAFRAWRVACAALGPASTLLAVVEVAALPLGRVLGFVPAGATLLTIAAPAPSATFDLVVESARVPCVVCPWAEPMDRRCGEAALAGRGRGSRWALLFNGTHVRLLDGSHPRARRWLDFDLDFAADDVRTFAALWTTLQAAMFAAPHAAAAPPLDRLVANADAFASGVCRSLRDGVLSASADVLTAMLTRRRSPDTRVAFEQALTVVYRMLFLLFAESRGLVPMWHPVYKTSYSIEALRLAAERERVAGLWDAVRAISRLAHAGCRAGDLRVTPFNGRLFDVSRAPFVERRDLDDHAAQRAVLALTTRISRERGGRERIAYRDLGVEQLGAVYETLLDYEPRPAHGPVILTRGSSVRKATGSFYTPQPIATYLVRQTLGHLVSQRTPEEVLALRVVDPSMGSGAFLVAACAFLADAYEEALLASGACLAADIGPAERAAIRRLVAERCLFGVDLNPMAVQLARLSLWLATLARDRPLSFLDHHLRTGDSVVGAWLSSVAHRPVRSARPRKARPLPLFDEQVVQDLVRRLVPVRFALAGPSDTVEQVRAKERALAGLEQPGSPLATWKSVADLWCAQWIDEGGTPPAAFRSLVDTLLGAKGELPHHVAAAHLARAANVAAAQRFFHWELEFPEVFFDGDGRRLPMPGFDAVIGNPPWDMLRSDSGTPEERARSRLEVARVRRFTRDAGVYEARSEGHSNRYQLFLERSVALLRDGGRLGLVLPGGFTSDQGSTGVRRLLFSRCMVDGLVSFENRRAIFPIHRGVRFVLATAEKGAPTVRFGARLGEVDPAVLEQEGSGGRAWFPLQISVDLLRHLSGDSLAVPDLRQPIDLAIAERAAALFAPLDVGWRVAFGRELNATDNQDLFKPPGHGLPVIEGKWLEPFGVRLDQSTHAVRRRDVVGLLGDRCERARLAYRDVASPTNRLTLIAALLPSGCVSTHTVFCLKTRLPLQAQYFLCGLFNSFVVNYLVRARVTTHVTTATVERLPVPRRNEAPAAFRAIAALAHMLTRNRATAPQADALARLNALVAALYQLSTEEFAHILSTFPLVDADTRSRVLAR